MVRYFIYAKDYSASTEEVQFYHENGLRTVEEFKSDIEGLLQSGESLKEYRIIYLHWGHECTEENEKRIVDDYKQGLGTGGNTLPETIIEWIQENVCEDDKIELLYIITDGLISSRSLNKCTELNKDMQYKKVVFHAFNEDLDEINLSVAVTFLKRFCKVYRNYELLDDTDISEEYDYDQIKVENFTTEKENLKSYIKLKYMNKLKHDALALKEIEKLKKVRDRLFSELPLKSQKSESNMNTMDKNVFLREFVATDWYRNLCDPVQQDKIEIEKSISTLINYIVSDQKSYSFDALKFDTNFDNPIEEEPIVDVNFTSEQEIEFPDIILDDDKGIPVIILTECNLLDKIILHKTNEDEVAPVSPASFNKFKSTMECPLFLLNDPDISESIGYFYTLNVYKQLLEITTRTEPRTRRPFYGGLVLLDTDQFDKYNDFILSATYFGSKKIHYNIGLFYYVLWKNCEKKEWMDKNVVEQFKKYVMRRISATKCRIGLSSLPLDPQVNTSLLTALWYCVELSSCIFKNDSQNFMQERLRLHYGVAHSMIEILKYFNYDLDLESIEKRRDLIRHVMILKKIQTREEKVYYLLDKIFKNDNGFLISEIENPSNLNKLNYLKFNHKSILLDDVIEEKVNLNDYVHIMHYVDFVDVRICEKTFRPFFTIDQNKSFYSELVKITKKVIISNDDGNKDKIKITFDAIDSLEFDKILSTYNLFIKCVKDLQKYPSLDEYIKYISKKKKFNGNLVTIFAPNLFIHVEHSYWYYQNNVMSKTDVHEFNKVCASTVSRFERIKVEDVLKFNNDKEIKEFISREELKVNLIKRV